MLYNVLFYDPTYIIPCYKNHKRKLANLSGEESIKQMVIKLYPASVLCAKKMGKLVTEHNLSKKKRNAQIT